MAFINEDNTVTIVIEAETEEEIEEIFNEFYLKQFEE